MWSTNFILLLQLNESQCCLKATPLSSPVSVPKGLIQDSPAYRNLNSNCQGIYLPYLPSLQIILTLFRANRKLQTNVTATVKFQPCSKTNPSQYRHQLCRKKWHGENSRERFLLPWKFWFLSWKMNGQYQDGDLGQCSWEIKSLLCCHWGILRTAITLSGKNCSSLLPQDTATAQYILNSSSTVVPAASGPDMQGSGRGNWLTEVFGQFLSL